MHEQVDMVHKSEQAYKFQVGVIVGGERDWGHKVYCRLLSAWGVHSSRQSAIIKYNGFKWQSHAVNSHWIMMLSSRNLTETDNWSSRVNLLHGLAGVVYFYAVHVGQNIMKYWDESLKWVVPKFFTSLLICTLSNVTEIIKKSLTIKV